MLPIPKRAEYSILHFVVLNENSGCPIRRFGFKSQACTWTQMRGRLSFFFLLKRR